MAKSFEADLPRTKPVPSVTLKKQNLPKLNQTTSRYRRPLLRRQPPTKHSARRRCHLNTEKNRYSAFLSSKNHFSPPHPELNSGESNIPAWGWDRAWRKRDPLRLFFFFGDERARATSTAALCQKGLRTPRRQQSKGDNFISISRSFRHDVDGRRRHFSARFATGGGHCKMNPSRAVTNKSDVKVPNFQQQSQSRSRNLLILSSSRKADWN